MYRVSRFNTVLRSFCTIAVVLALAQVAAAQSVQSTLNFTGTAPADAGPASVAVTNPTSNFADVQFTLYNADGTLAPATVNPVSYRVPPRAQVAMSPEQIFGRQHTGWIQATSLTAGLQGFYFVGDFKNTLEGAESAASIASNQIIPFLASGAILVTNPGAQSASVTVIFTDDRGQQVPFPQASVPAHGQVQIPMRPNSSARVSSSAPVAASGILQRTGSVMLVNGQDDLRSATTRFIPHFASGNGTDSTLVLTNPSPSPITVTVRVYSADSAAPLAIVPVPIRGYGSVSQTWGDLYGRTPTPLVTSGWIRIDVQQPVPLDGMLVMDSGSGLTTIPMQSSPFDRLLFSRTVDDQDLYSQLALLTGDSTANLTITLNRADGATLAQVSKQIGANTKVLANVRDRDWFPNAASLGASFMTIRSSAPVYGVEIVGASANRLLASVAPQAVGISFVPPAVTAKIVDVSNKTVRPETKLRVSLGNADVTDNVSFLFGSQAATAQAVSPISPIYDVTVPQIEPGYTTLKLRVDGVEFDSMLLRVADVEGTLTETLHGRAFYQKPAVTDAGLDLTQTVMVPIRNARVEVFDRSLGLIVSVSETDSAGQYTLAVPNQPDLVVRVKSRLRNLDLTVADNTNAGALYEIATDVDVRQQQGDVLLIDVNATPLRISGAFNILEAIQRGNDLIARADPRIATPSFTMFWSVRNTNRAGNPANGLIGGTEFRLSTGTAYILGDRATDSDEFDDSVLLHEYAHMLAVKFSRDDSPGGSHSTGDVLDPRVAWSEGFANFFSSAARNNPVYTDSYGPNGVKVLRYYLEDNVPTGDNPGIWSESSVQSLLWDLFDDAADDGDSSQFDFSLIWSAFTDLRNDHFVYLPYFLDHFIERSPESSDTVRVMAQVRSIQFLPGQRPSVSNPFPRLLIVGQAITGDEVDSLTTKRTNLMNSSHFYTFTTTGGATGIRLSTVGLGPGNDRSHNDLDLYLMDLNGRLIAKSNTSDPNGELIKGVTLPAGSYVVEVRSYYTNASTGAIVYNSGQYNLVVNIQ